MALAARAHRFRRRLGAFQCFKLADRLGFHQTCRAGGEKIRLSALAWRIKIPFVHMEIVYAARAARAGTLARVHFERSRRAYRASSLAKPLLNMHSACNWGKKFRSTSPAITRLPPAPALPRRCSASLPNGMALNAGPSRRCSAAAFRKSSCAAGWNAGCRLTAPTSCDPIPRGGSGRAATTPPGEVRRNTA